MRTLLVLSTILIIRSQLLISQNLNLSGKVIDATTNQPIEGAVIKIINLEKTRVTNETGNFTFENITPGEYLLAVSHFVYLSAESHIVVDTENNEAILILLKPILFHSDEVIIKSTRTLSTKNETAYPLDVILSERLVQIPKFTISDMLSDIPGIAIVRDGTWQTTVSIRGLSRSNVISLIDNIRIETANDIAGALSLININDLERVESIKSSGSVLYGTGALGGVVHFVTKRPSFSEESKINSELTNSASSVNGELSHHAAVDVSSDRYTLRLSGGYRNAGNTKTPAGALPNSQYRDFSFSGSVGIKTTSEQNIFLSYQRSQAEDVGIPGGSPFGTTAVVRYTLARRELFSAEYNIPNISEYFYLFTVRASHQKISRNVEIIQNPTLTVTPHAVHSTISAQIESKLIPMKNHFLVIGAEAWERTLDSHRERYQKSQNRIIGERPIPESKFLNIGIYSQDEWKILPNELILTTGARYDWIKVQNEKTYNPEYIITSGEKIINTADSTILWKRGSAHDESWSANVGLNYFLNSQTGLTLLVATAFRSPSLEERYQYLDLGKGYVIVGNPNLQPERSYCVNVGLRAASDFLKIRADLFLNRLTNLISEEAGLFEGRQALVKKNIGKAQLYGYEILCENSLTNWSALKVSVSYVRGEDLRNNTNLAQLNPLNGEIALSIFLKNIGSVNTSCLIFDKQRNPAVGETPTAGYGTANINFVSNPFEIWQFSVTARMGIQNIFDKAYRNYLATLRGVIKEEPGRNIFLSVTVKM